jgi:hypothetical protein
VAVPTVWPSGSVTDVSAIAGHRLLIKMAKTSMANWREVGMAKAGTRLVEVVF